MSLIQLVQSLIISPASSLVNFLLFVAQDSFYPRRASPPARRTNTQHLTTFTRPSPAAVTYDVSQPHSTTITVPPHSTWSTGPHWHERHTEYLQVLEGLALVMLNGEIRVYGPSDGVIEVPKFTLHEWQREAEGYVRADGEEEKDLVVREWTRPADGQKEIFFRVLNSYVMEPEPQRLHGWLPAPHFIVALVEQHVVILQLLLICRGMDNWPTFGNGIERVDWLTWAITHNLFHIAWVIGTCLGLRERYDEYVRLDSTGKSSGYMQQSKERME